MDGWTRHPRPLPDVALPCYAPPSPPSSPSTPACNNLGMHGAPSARQGWACTQRHERPSAIASLALEKERPGSSSLTSRSAVSPSPPPPGRRPSSRRALPLGTPLSHLTAAAACCRSIVRVSVRSFRRHSLVLLPGCAGPHPAPSLAATVPSPRRLCCYSTYTVRSLPARRPGFWSSLLSAC